MTTGPWVSVVVATRNRATLLPSCIDSLLRQKGVGEFELIVVDNGSTDRTAEIVGARAERDSRLRLVDEARIGLSRAKNAGIAHARGGLILFTDDDVVVPDDWIAAYVRFFHRNGSPSTLAGGPILPVPQDLAAWPPWVTSKAVADLPRLYHGPLPRRLVAYEWLWGANMAAPKRLLTESGGFDEELGVAGDARGTFEDVELVQRMTSRGAQCWYLPDAIVHHRTPATAARPRSLVGKAFNRGANDVLRDGRRAYYERSWPVPRRPRAAALAAPLALLGCGFCAGAFRVTRHTPAFELTRRLAWASGWCTARGAGPSTASWRRAAVLGRSVVLKITPL